MAAKKITITLPEELVMEINAAAIEDDIPVSRWVANAAREELRLRISRKVVAEWEAENGAFTPEEIAEASAAAAEADAEALRRYRQHRSAA